MKLTTVQQEVLSQLPDNGTWGVPLSTAHNGTLAALIKKGLVEWSGGALPNRLWRLSRGVFRRTGFEPIDRIK